MWASRAELNYLRNRVIELERQLSAERTENRRAERWMTNMLMRRAGSIPVPPPAPEKVEPEIVQPEPGRIDEALAIAEEGRRLGKSRLEIEEALRPYNVTEQELAAAIGGVQ